MSAEVITGQVFEGASVVLLARLIDLADGSAIQQSDLASASYDVWIVDPPAEPPAFEAPGLPVKYSGPNTLTIADVVFNALQTSGWSADDTGYNVRISLAASAFPRVALSAWPDSQRFRVDAVFVTGSGAKYPIAWEIEAIQHLHGKG